MSSKPLVSFDTIAEGHPYFLDPDGYPDWPDLFQNKHPLKLEIGFGNGNFLIEKAIQNPDDSFIGMDFYHKGIRKVITRLDRLKIENVRVVYGDAREKFPLVFRDGELSEIYINFPDPWPKKRHLKRRLIKPPFVELLSRKLAPEGTLRVATDYEPYAVEILDFIDADPGLSNKNREGGFSMERDDCPKTKYEKTFLSAGKKIFYLDFKKVSDYMLKTLSEPASVM